MKIFYKNYVVIRQINIKLPKNNHIKSIIFMLIFDIFVFFNN